MEENIIMAEFGKDSNNQVPDEDQHSTYLEFTPGNGAIIDAQPTYVREGSREGSTTAPLALVENTDPGDYVPQFHQMGIDVLQITDQLLIQQTVELLDLIAAIESENRYLIKVPRGDTIFEVAERSSGWQRAMLGSARSFSLHVFDRSRREVLLIRRQAACSCCLMHCCCACFQRMEIFSPPYTLLGSITQEWSLFIPSFFVKNAAGDIVYKIEGPSSCLFSVNTESSFKILTYDGTREVGSIVNQWNDLHLQHNLRVIFPFEENAAMRAVLLGAAFLMQYMFYESSKKARRVTFSRFNNS